jgi:hypothetical protein
MSFNHPTNPATKPRLSTLPFRKATINIFRNLAGRPRHIFIYKEPPLLNMSASKEIDVGGNDVIAPSPANGQRKILGQTRAAWYIYWICAVASIANM